MSFDPNSDPATAAPRRVQLSRRRGWRLPPNTVVVSRPSKWGNPFVSPDRADAVSRYRSWLLEQLATGRLELSPLRGRNLACWCPPGEPCHADVLLELANPAPATAR